MLQTNADALLCLRLHTVRSPYTLHASNQCRCLAVPTAAHSSGCVHSACFKPMPMSCCVYSCTQYGLHTQYMLQTNADVLLCLQLHTVRAAYTVHASNQCRCLAVPTAAHSTVSPFLTIVMFSFEPSHVSLILLKYKCRFLFSCRQCNITSYPHILKPNKLLCLQ